MSTLQVQYMGLPLKNPLLAASSGKTSTADRIAACEDAGASAVVIKSLFQEEIDSRIHSLETASHPEGYDYASALQTGFDLEAYCTLIRQAKDRVDIPVFGSLNAFRQEWWVEHLPQLESAGSDGIELNLALLPGHFNNDEKRMRQWYVDVVREASAAVSVPIAVKIGPYFTSIPLMVDELYTAGAQAVVLFNRFYRFDIDIHDFSLRSGSPFSTSDDLALPLRWISLLYGRSTTELAASSGIHTGDDLVKVLLAGAQIGQACSTLYRNGMEQIQNILNGLTAYMEQHHFDSIDSFRGKVCQNRSDVPESFERLQYIKSLTGSPD